MIKEILKDITIEPSLRAKELASRYGYRPYMIERYLNIMPEGEVIQLLEAFERRLKPVIRCNDLRIDCSELVKALNRLGFELRLIEWSSIGYRVVKSPKSPTIGSTHEYLKGYYYVYRDAASLIPPIVLDPKPGDVVLDMCAAPGGKATHIAQLLRGSGVVVANDISRRRVIALINHTKRLGLTNVIVTNYDARKLPKVIKLRFRKVLLDAPCSAEGGIMFDPSRKVKTSIRDLAMIIEREISLLKAAIELLESGGVVVYTTCSIAPEENEYVITKVVESRDDVKVVEPAINLWSRGIEEYHRLKFVSDVKRCIRVWPHKHGMEGFFICVLRKTS